MLKTDYHDIFSNNTFLSELRSPLTFLKNISNESWSSSLFYVYIFSMMSRCSIKLLNYYIEVNMSDWYEPN
jgi:hypothetical protein